MSDRLATTLLAHYASLRELTARVRTAAEAGQIDTLDALLDERAAAVDVAEGLLSTLLAERAASSDATVSRVLTERLNAALRVQLSEDEALRALLSSQAQEIPRQLADLRGAHRGLSGYQRAALDPNDLVDRSG